MKLGLGLCLAMMIASCSGDPGRLVIQLRTDLVPGAEFAEIRVEAEDSSGRQYFDRVTPEVEADYLGGVSIRTWEVAKGAATVGVELLNRTRGVVIGRQVAVQVSQATAVTIVLTRSCMGVQCDEPSAPACLGGRCVSADCSPENPELCGAADCSEDNPCAAAMLSCVQTVCVAATCLEQQVPSECGEAEYCDSTQGCLPLDIPDASIPNDGGMSMPDAGLPRPEIEDDPCTALSSDGPRLVTVSVGANAGDLVSGGHTIRSTFNEGPQVFTFNPELPADVGIGDRLVFGSQTAHIAAVRSRSQVVLATVDGAELAATDGEVPVEAYRHHSSLGEAFAELSTDLGTSSLPNAGVRLALAVYMDGPLDEFVAIGPDLTTDAEHYLRIYTPHLGCEVGDASRSQRHRGRAGTGAVLQPSTVNAPPFAHAILVSVPFVRIEGLEIDLNGVQGGQSVRGIAIFGAGDAWTESDVRLDSNLIHGAHQVTDGAGAFGIINQHAFKITYSNNIIYDITATNDGAAFGIFSTYESFSEEHNPIAVYNTVTNVRSTNQSALGIQLIQGNPAVLLNNYASGTVGPGGAFDLLIAESSLAIAERNVSGDSDSAVELNSVAGTTSNLGGQSDLETIFVNPSGDDYHLRGSSNTLMGVEAQALHEHPEYPVTTDVDGEPRSTSSPSIGADEPSQ